MRFFNTTGPCKPEYHYMLPLVERLSDVNIKQMIDQHSYFILHAPRQTGKTTLITELAQKLTASGQYTAVVVTMEVGAGFPNDIGPAETAILHSWRLHIEYYLPPELWPSPWPDAPVGQRIDAALTMWSKENSRPLVVFLDEIDALQNEVLISVLRQLRAGFARRPQAFPASLALVGLRDVRDYKVASGGSDRLSSPSPFNIAVRSITLDNFDAAEVSRLLQQHTDETGQLFTPEAQALIFNLTQGQPWLVNALAKVCVEELVKDVKVAVAAAHIATAKEILIQRRQTHLDQLTDKLRQPRVRRVIEPMLAGEALNDIPQDDIEYLLDLGLCRLDSKQGLTIANPIYQEILPRALAYTTDASIPYLKPIWLNENGSLNARQLLQAFLAFWRQHGQPLLKSAPYHEIAPHLVLMAFLHRVVNGGGTLEREYAIGTGKMDLCLRYGDVTLAMELKVWRDNRPDPLPEGLNQLDEYLSGLGLETGWLVLLDQRTGQPDISERTTAQEMMTPRGRKVTLIRA